jgi:Carboxypeptidase regulatory-like domain
MRMTRLSCGSFIIILALAAAPCFAQFTTASLGGIVVDATGASMPQAKVTVLNQDTGYTRTDMTAADGAFSFPALPVGTYRLTVEQTGFSTYVQEGITLAVNQVANQRVTLQVGSTTNHRPG